MTDEQQRDYVMTRQGIVRVPGEQAGRLAWESHVATDASVRWATAEEVAAYLSPEARPAPDDPADR